MLRRLHLLYVVVIIRNLICGRSGCVSYLNEPLLVLLPPLRRGGGLLFLGILAAALTGAKECARARCVSLWLLLGLARLEPGILEQLLGRNSSLRLHDEHARQEIPCLFAHVVGGRKLAFRNFLIKFLVGLPLEREVAAEKRVQEDTRCPYISWRSKVIPLLHYLWRHVRGRPTKDFQLSVWCRAATETKIYQLKFSSFSVD